MLKEYIQQIYRELLTEKQRFAKETGKKFDQDTFLQQYKNDPWVFAHYSPVPKLGILPNAAKFQENETPAGIYAYPIKSIMNGFENVPYGEDRRYIVIFQLKPEAQNNAIILNGGGSIIKSPIPSREMLQILRFKIEEQPSLYFSDDHGKPMQNILAMSMQLSNGNPLRWRKFLYQDLGISAIIDNDSASIHVGEPTQAVFFSVRDLELVHLIDRGEIGTEFQEKLGGGNWKRGDRVSIQYYDSKGSLHREDGPALIGVTGIQEWFKHGKPHREDGPAYIVNGYPEKQQWYYEGKFYGNGPDRPANFPG